MQPGAAPLSGDGLGRRERHAVEEIFQVGEERCFARVHAALVREVDDGARVRYLTQRSQQGRECRHVVEAVGGDDYVPRPRERRRQGGAGTGSDSVSSRLNREMKVEY